MNEGPSTSSQGCARSKATAQKASSIPRPIYSSAIGERVEAKVIHTGSGDVYFTDLQFQTRDKRTNEQTKSDCEELQQKLETEAGKQCEIEQVFCVNRRITIAPLQISEQQDPQSAEELGHYHHRGEILQVISKPPIGNVEVEDLFIKAKQFTIKSGANKTHLTEAARDVYITVHSNIVGVTGQAGIGKTTLTKSILQKVLDENLYGSEFIFYLKLRDCDYNAETDLLSFLTPALAFNWKSDKQRRNAVLNALAASDHLLIIFDGFDEANKDNDSTTNHTINLYSQAKPLVFIKHILRGKILPNANKIFTSRPKQLLELPTDLRPHFIVNILGLDIKAQQQLCKEICHESSNQVLGYVENHPDIAAYCYVPINCILVMHSIETINALKSEFSNTLTGLFSVVLGLFILTSHVDKHFNLEKFANLAWNSFKDNKFHFSESDLRKVGLRVEERSAFLVTTLLKTKITLLGGDTEKVCYFTHLLLQECLVAIKLLFFTTPAEFKRLFVGTPRLNSLERFKPEYDLAESRFEMITKFLFGFCNVKTLSYLKIKFPSLALSSEHVRMLENFALKHLPSHKDRFIYIGSALPVSHWAYERNDSALSNKIASRLPSNTLIGERIFPSDVAAIHNLLRFRKTRTILNIVDFPDDFVGDSFQLFVREMKHTCESSPLIEIEDLRTDGPKIGDGELIAIASYVDKVKKLKLEDNESNPITIKGIAALSTSIQELRKPIKRLDLFNCKFGDDGFIALPACIRNIEEIRIGSRSDNQLTMTGITALSEAVQKLHKPMEFLGIFCDRSIQHDARQELERCKNHCNTWAINLF